MAGVRRVKRPWFPCESCGERLQLFWDTERVPGPHFLHPNGRVCVQEEEEPPWLFFTKHVLRDYLLSGKALKIIQSHGEELSFSCEASDLVVIKEAGVVVYGADGITFFEVVEEDLLVEEQASSPIFIFYYAQILEQWDQQKEPVTLRLNCLRDLTEYLKLECFQLALELGYVSYQGGGFSETAEVLHKAMLMATRKEPTFLYLWTISDDIGEEHTLWWKVGEVKRCLSCSEGIETSQVRHPFCDDCFDGIVTGKTDACSVAVQPPTHLEIIRLRRLLSWVGNYPMLGAGEHCGPCKEKPPRNQFPDWYGRRAICFSCLSEQAEIRGIVEELEDIIETEA
jgi:hypothetical protein